MLGKEDIDMIRSRLVGVLILRLDTINILELPSVSVSRLNKIIDGGYWHHQIKVSRYISRKTGYHDQFKVSMCISLKPGYNT